MPGNRETALKLFVVLSRASTAVAAQADADVDRHGISLTEFASLEALYHKGPLLVGELQRSVLRSSGGMTYVVDRLEEKGLVQRRPCPEDRRAMYAELTDAGRALMDRIFPEHAAWLERSLEGLTPKEQRQAIDLLKRLGRHAAALPRPSAAGAAGAR